VYGAGTELYEYYLEVVKPQQSEAKLETTELTFSKEQAKQYHAYTQGGKETKSKRKASSVGKKAQGRSKASRKTRTR
jgi:hypothetical protein